MSKKISVNDSALASIIGNLVGNCIDAVKHFENELKTVDIVILLNENYLTIRTVNYCDPNKIKFNEDGSLMSTKKTHKKEHGYGNQIIRLLANKEGGTLNYTIEGNKFISDVLLYCQEVKE